MRLESVVALGLTFAACAHSVRVPPAAPATGRFEAGQRDQRYANALRALQLRGYTVAVSDRAGGVIATQPLEGRASYACGDVKMTSPFSHEVPEPCGLRQTLQVTLTEAGEAIVRVNREQFFLEGAGKQLASYWGPASTPLAVADVARLQAELLAEVLAAP